MRKATQHKLHTPIPPIEEWLAIRRRNYGLDCFPAFLEFEDPLPEEIIRSPLMQGFIRRAGIMCILANVSYLLVRCRRLSLTTLLLSPGSILP